MATSKVKFTKICEHCGKEFEAQKTTTRFCSKRCAEHAYKERMRQQRVSLSNQLTDAIKNKEEEIPARDFLSVKDAALVLGLNWRTIYDMIYRGQLKATRITPRLTVIRREDIEVMIASGVYQRVPRENKPITEFYTMKEIEEKFGVGTSWVFKICKEKGVPKTLHHGKTLWSKRHVDAAFGKKTQPQQEEITEWYTADEIMAKFGMTLTAVYNYISDKGIPKKKEHGKTFYSKKHIDVAKGVTEMETPQFYTTVEAMKKFGITRDQLDHYLRTYKIPRVKEGRYIKIDKAALDRIFEPPKI